MRDRQFKLAGGEWQNVSKASDSDLQRIMQSVSEGIARSPNNACSREQFIERVRIEFVARRIGAIP